jgi:phosphoribosylanthranilate isomerase
VTLSFHIKICGITTVEDAVMVARAGADAIGLNFYAESPRCVSRERAAEIVAATPPNVTKVGLFVDAQAREICAAFDDLGLDLIQLHGAEPPDFLRRLGDRPVMRAFRLGPDGLAPIAHYLDECRLLGCLPHLVLLDAFVPGVPGGTGNVADWPAAAQYRAQPGSPPLVLAGGLTAENVAEAVRATGTATVDTASGVESSPGRKDAAKVEAFIREARRAVSPPA